MKDNVIPATLWSFLLSITHILWGLYAVLMGSLPFKVSDVLLKTGIIALAFFTMLLMYGPTKRAIFSWGIEKEYRAYDLSLRWRKNTFAFLFFWGSFILFFYLGVRFLSRYAFSNLKMGGIE
ncbi:hypothetical protein [Flagellimonas marinaquae]|uniref:hypothetical protein n=1 Tax=Flagellimonas marinaquae TaxID=254955 RepID=UPI002074FA1E|nr:hypothetical protein [Allomuricauda aquimarina]USD26881.1 hypothetical protein MJO53_08280 [Allomuricauda aquimarina]